MKPKWILSITAGWAQATSIKRCKEMGFRVLSVDENPNAVGFEFSDDWIVSKIDDIDNIINYINSKKITPTLRHDSRRLARAVMFIYRKLKKLS